MRPSLRTLGSNLLCSVDTETTGVKPGYSEIIQITLQPLNFDFEPHDDYRPFNQLICPDIVDDIPLDLPRHVKRILKDALEWGISAAAAAVEFDQWFQSLDLGRGMIAPLATNWPFDNAMILHWLSADDYAAKFHGHYRDLMCVAAFINDRCETYNDPATFPKLSLPSIANRLGVGYDSALLHESFYDCRLVARCYRAALAMHLKNF